jgi:hypothetical protein
MRTLRIGGGAGYSGDRIEPSIELAERGELDYLVFECLAERTIALAQQARQSDPGAGFDPWLRQRMRAVLPACVARGTRIVTNMGAAHPLAAARACAEVAAELGLPALRVAAVTGDDVLDKVLAGELRFEESGEPVADYRDRLVSANAYLGAEGIVRALRGGAQVVITGRVADPALFLGPLVHEFGWAFDDWERLGRGTLVGHLLECAGQLTGGYFADPGYKHVPGLARLGFPIGEVDETGNAEFSKVSGSGGRITEAACKEQLLYEIHDPAAYLQPDVTADFSQVSVAAAGADRVRVGGARGRARPDTLKVSVGYRDGFVGEGQISYGGPGALERALLARDVVRERLRITGLPASELRCDVLGLDSLYGERRADASTPTGCVEFRLRVAARVDSAELARRVGNEVETLYTNGPAGGGGASQTVRAVLAVQSLLLPRAWARAEVHAIGAGASASGESA